MDYLYPNLSSKKAFKEALERGETIIAKQLTPFGDILIQNETVAFEGPHFPKPHKFYGNAVVKEGKVIKIT